MGRELKRVALDFSWPLKKVWSGFVNHHAGKSKTCPHCQGSGSSPFASHLKDRWYGYAPFHPSERGSAPFEPSHPAVHAFAERNVKCSPEYYGPFSEEVVLREANRLLSHWNGQWCHHLNDDDVAALVAADRLYVLTHTWSRETGWKKKEPAHVPTAAEVNAWSIGPGMGHDGINCWVVITAECKRLGEPVNCIHCDGEGSLWASAEDRKAYDEWEQTEPPEGEGYQIWETVTEGSPISPVFATPEQLARYMAGRRWGADEGTPYEGWLAFINGPGWAPSLVGGPDGVKGGVSAVVEMASGI